MINGRDIFADKHRKLNLNRPFVCPILRLRHLLLSLVANWRVCCAAFDWMVLVFTVLESDRCWARSIVRVFFATGRSRCGMG